MEIPEDAIYIVDSSTTLNKEFQVVPKYIDDCIKAKELLPLESYIVRRAGESPPSTSRNNFTAEEDQLLLRIVRAKEAEGLKTGGIKLYNNIADLVCIACNFLVSQTYTTVLETEIPEMFIEQDCRRRAFDSSKRARP